VNQDGAHRAPGAEAPFTVRLPAEPVALPALRDALSAWLQRLQWPDEECVGIVHAANEACTNVVEHAYAFPGAGEVELSGRVHDAGLRRHVVITVEDQGEWRAPSAPGTDTWGLAMMRAFTHRVNVHARPRGTRVSMVSCAVPHAPGASRPGYGSTRRRPGPAPHRCRPDRSGPQPRRRTL
jgi:anti-sigma regulatory factor (Ser/Thr protein kinase)